LFVGAWLLINLTMNDEVGLFGYLDRVHELAERPTALDKLNESIDWSCFEPVLKEHLNFNPSLTPPWLKLSIHGG
jgi:hypothetical protein